MKKNPLVAAAEAAASVKADELAAARENLLRLEREHAQALAAVRQAQEQADAALPQCRIVRVAWRSGTEQDFSQGVILRKTPSGMLVVRKVGDATDGDRKFKWRDYSGKFMQAERSISHFDWLELRDVPAEYLPTKAPA